MIIIIIPLIFGVGIYLYALNTVRTDLQTIQEQTNTSIFRNIEGTIDNLQKVSYTLSNNAYNAGIYLNHTTTNPESSLSVAQVQKNISSYVAANDSIDEIYLYFPANDYILQSNLVYQYAGIQKNTEQFLRMSQEDFDYITTQSTEGKLVYLESAHKIYYIYSGSIFKNQIKMIIPLDMNAILQISLQNHMGTCLYIEDDIVWIQNNPGTVSDEYISTIEESDRFRKDAGQIWWMRKDSEKYGYSLITCIDGNIFFGKIHVMGYILVGYLILTMSIGITVIIYFSKKNYSPVTKLLEDIGVEHAGGSNEFETLSNYYLSLLEKYHFSEEQLMKNKEYIHNQKFVNLIHGGKAGMIEKMLVQLDPEQVFVTGRYCLVGILITQENGQKIEDYEQYQLAQFIVNNITTEVLEKKYDIISGEVDGFLLFMIHLSSEERDSKDLVDTLNHVIYYVEHLCHMEITVNVSHVSQHITHACGCFDDVKSLQEYRDWRKDDNSIIRTIEELNGQMGNSLEPISNYRKVEEIYKLMREQKYQYASELLNTLLEENHKTEKDDKKTKRKEVIIQEIVDYIEHHYDDWQLSGTMFAEKYQMSLSYLSQIFKKYKGIGLLDYINQIRFFKAKEMIEQGETVQMAAQKVGFSTAQPLRRLYRQFEGTTPGQKKNKE